MLWSERVDPCAARLHVTGCISPEARYLAQSVDACDLEVRIQALERVRC